MTKYNNHNSLNIKIKHSSTQVIGDRKGPHRAIEKVPQGNAEKEMKQSFKAKKSRD